MTLHARIAASFDANRIERVLIIDDAYDAPTLNDAMAGPLLGMLRGGNQELLDTLGVGDELLSEAVEALSSEEYENPSLLQFVGRLYQAFVESGDTKFDPEGNFDLLKGTALKALHPLETFLMGRQATDVRRVGLVDARTVFAAFKPQIVFLDFFLSANVAESGSVDDENHLAARTESVVLLNNIVSEAPGTVPAVVLMSSKDMSARKDEFRREAQPKDGSPKIVSWRFHFLRKGNIDLQDAQPTFTPEAADALLDTCQSYRFGRELHQALFEWKRGLDGAVEALTLNIADLDIKDFAYLMRFRLQEEGQPLSEYLNWLFGESLVETIRSTVDWDHDSFRKLDGNDEGIMDPIEGAYDGPTIGIAKLFDRARIERRRYNGTSSKRLGDIFRIGDTDRLRAIVTPDCDLVVRNGSAKVSRPLTVSGKLKRYDSPTTPLADFIIVDEKDAHSIEWDAKDLETTDFSVGDLTYMGTLRPIYAQELQRTVLADLGRIGVAVPPVIGMTAEAEVHLRSFKMKKNYKNHTTQRLKLQMGDRACCTIMPSRNQRATASIIFHREFVHRMLEAMRTFPRDNLADGVGDLMDNAMTEGAEEEIYGNLCIAGVSSGDVTAQRISIVFGKAVMQGDDAPWCQIIVKASELSMEQQFQIASAPRLSVESEIATTANFNTEDESRAFREGDDHPRSGTAS
ncbi:hypothetical protein N7I30_15335 [Aurantimonas litoralis]|nr:hypothetical protein [Aurantimonas litoralis]